MSLSHYGLFQLVFFALNSGSSNSVAKKNKAYKELRARGVTEKFMNLIEINRRNGIRDWEAKEIFNNWGC